MKVHTSGRRVAGIAATAVAALVAVGTPAMAAGGAKPAPTIPPSARIAPRVSHPSSGTPAPPQVRRFASQDGGCDVGDVCLYYFNSSLSFGSGYDTAHNDPNLFNNHFISPGAGQGQVVGNNAEAVWNRDPRTTVYVCTGLSSQGTCGFVPPNTLYNLFPTFSNHVQSLFWADSTN
jgi:hypothetical protein